MIAVGPHATGFDAATHAVGHVAIARPHTCTQTVQRIVGQSERVGFVFECGHCQHRTENFLLENTHFVVAFEHGRLDVVAIRQITRHLRTFAADQHLSAFLFAQIQIRADFGHLLLRSLRADHGVRIQRIALLDCGDALQTALHEFIVNGFMDQRARWAGADFALIEGEQYEAFDRFV